MVTALRLRATPRPRYHHQSQGAREGLMPKLPKVFATADEAPKGNFHVEISPDLSKVALVVPIEGGVSGRIELTAALVEELRDVLTRCLLLMSFSPGSTPDAH
jgi:hypothetical protein